MTTRRLPREHSRNFPPQASRSQQISFSPHLYSNGGIFFALGGKNHSLPLYPQDPVQGLNNVISSSTPGSSKSLTVLSRQILQLHTTYTSREAQHTEYSACQSYIQSGLDANLAAVALSSFGAVDLGAASRSCE